MIKYLSMTIESNLPQQIGASIVEAKAKKLPDGSPEQMELIAIRNARIDVGDMIAEASPVEGPKTGRLNSRKGGKLSPQERADAAARQMLEAGKTPQEIGIVIAGILGFRG